MLGHSVTHIPSLDVFRSHADRWDQLWSRSEVTAPTARSELIAQWVRHFDFTRGFQAVAICEGDRFVGALPLVVRRKRSVIECKDIPGNAWSSAGQLLLDPAANISRVCDLLVAELVNLPAPTYWFDAIPVNAPRWRALTAAASRAHLAVNVGPRYPVGRIRPA